MIDIQKTVVMMPKSVLQSLILILLISGCNQDTPTLPWTEHASLTVKPGSRIIEYTDGTPFLWIGCTSWGMTEWLDRRQVGLYLDDRQSKGMNVVQLCLFWGKRTDYPTKFYLNPENAYGHRAFVEKNGLPDVSHPAVVKGGSPVHPNDYWDHVDFCLHAIKERGMYAAVLPIWGRRYVNATHEGQSARVFTPENIKSYGEFLGERYGNEPNIIWVLGGDVQATFGGDFTGSYRLLAEGLAKGVTQHAANWNMDDPIWDSLLLTYHPDGDPMLNSSNWFHHDPWLDFNMIETYKSRDMVVKAIKQDRGLTPVKPTILGEGQYEGTTDPNGAPAKPINVRRQAYQAFFAGAAGFTYGGAFDQEGNGPLFSPANNWEHLLQWPGANQMRYLRKFLQDNKWWNWQPLEGIFVHNKGEGDLEKLAVKSANKILVYFPDTSSCTIKNVDGKSISWFRPSTGAQTEQTAWQGNTFTPPQEWNDAVLIIERKTGTY